MPHRARTASAALLCFLSAAACTDISQSVAPPPDATLAKAHAPSAGTAIVLRGTILTPDGVIKHGYVAVENGRIVSVSDKQPTIAGAVSVNTNGIIVPGFVDVHNHLTFNVLPRWSAGRLFTNRDQWRTDPEHQRAVLAPIAALGGSHACDINAWGELRALVGGTTSTMTTRPVPCIQGLVRNLDYNSGFYGTAELDREHIFNVLQVPPPSDPAARASFVFAARNFFIANPFYEALVMHVAEGTDAAAHEEFTFLQSQSLLNPKGAVIHGITLGAADFQAMAATGTSLVWSPRSNIDLYGTTANIAAALDAGVEIALAPDWAVTGSSNMLDELKTASQWNRDHVGGRLTDRQLVDMTTSAAASVAGISDEVGSIRAGLRADLLVIDGNHNDAAGAVVNARTGDVQLVLIGGVPMYGARKVMERFWTAAQLEDIALPDGTKSLATTAAGVSASAIAGRLSPALIAQGTSLAPLAEASASRGKAP